MSCYQNKVKSNIREMVGGSALAIALVMCRPVTAATQDAAATQDDTGDIIVTAQRRSQRLQDVPISLAVVGGDDLAANEISTVAELAPRIPNFSMTRSPAGRAITMRGVGASTGSPSLEQSVVIFVDGIYGGNNRQFAAAFLDVERIEVLRGPQGALVGKNTVAGAINLISRRPTDEFGGFLNANYDFLLDGPTIEGGVNIPLGNGFGMRIVGSYSDLQGYVRNLLTDRDEPTRKEFVGRVSLGYENGGPVTAYLKYEHTQSDGVGSVLQVWSPTIPGYELDYNKYAFTSDRPETNIFDTNNLMAQFDFDIDWATLTSITGYSGFKSREHTDSEWTPVDGGISDFDMDLDQFSQEFRIVSAGGGNFDYAAGALFQISDLYEGRTTGVLFQPSANSFRIMNQTTKDISVYAQAGYDLGQVRLQGSLRYTNVRKEANYQRFTGPQVLQYIGTRVRDFDGNLENNLWDPSVVLQYRPTSRVMLYASFQMGSKSGGFQGAISNAESFSFVISPERSTSYEAGAKLSFGGGSYLNLAAFHTVYDDLQMAAAQLAPDGLSTPFFVGNAGTARVIGLEFDGFVRITPAFDLAVNGAWNPEAKYTSFRSGPCPDDGVAAPPGDRTGSCNLSGTRLPYSPRFQANVTAQYKQEVADDFLFTASVTAYYRSSARQSADLGNPLFYVQDDYVKFDGRLAVGTSDGRWEFGIVGRNLTNRLTKDNVGIGGFSRTVLARPQPGQPAPPAGYGRDAHSVTVAPPRQILATAALKF